MRSLAADFDFPVLLTHCAGDQLGWKFAVNVEAHGRPAQVRRLQLAGAVQPALLSYGEEKRDRWVRQSVLQQRLGQSHEHRTACAIVAAERGGAVGDNPVAFTLR